MFGGIRRIYGVSTAYVADLESNIYAPRVVARDKKRRLHKQSEFGLGSRVYSLVIILRTIPILYNPRREVTKIDIYSEREQNTSEFCTQMPTDICRFFTDTIRDDSHWDPVFEFSSYRNFSITFLECGNPVRTCWKYNVLAGMPLGSHCVPTC